MNALLIAKGLQANDALAPVLKEMGWIFEKVGLTDIAYLTSPEEALQRIMEKLREPIKWAVNLAFLAGTIYFIYKAVLAGIPYFNSDNPNERSQALDKLRQSLIGAGFCVAGGVLVNLLLDAFGVSPGWEL